MELVAGGVVRDRLYRFRRLRRLHGNPAARRVPNGARFRPGPPGPVKRTRYGKLSLGSGLEAYGSRSGLFLFKMCRE